ncbi:creatine kinase M-type-like [Oryzias latipes]|uniref:creatine kinase n=1 Tax=Oryzias latipes TaxID=8090 RepID=H2L698_ORYLA|nr:creatine kinase M-type-like [Oryzias latipes]
MWKVKPPVVFPMETRYRCILENLVPPDPMSQFHLRRGSPEEEFPDLCRNFTWMGRILTPAMYRRQFDRCTPSGVMFDDVIRLGIEEPGEWCGPVTVGCLAGDAQSYILFCDFFDRIIEAYHEHKVTSKTPESDSNYDNLKGGDDLDRSFAVYCEVSVTRAVEDFCFPSHCSRGERRHLLSLARRALQKLEAELPGQLFLLEELSRQQQAEMKAASPTSLQLRCGVARDWPDARAVWLSQDGRLVIWVNIDDHLRLVSHRDDANVAEAFKRVFINLQKLEDHYRALKHPFIWKQQLGWVTSSPADVGTGLKVSIHLKLQLLPQHKRLPDVLTRLKICMEKTESPEVYSVRNIATFGQTEVELTQLVVDGVKLLIAMEKRLQASADIHELLPSHK